MTRSVALLRGINVGTQTRIAMPALRAVFESLGATSVETYLQSGNVVFEGSLQVEQVETAISTTLGVSPRVLLLTAQQYRAVVAEIPIREMAVDPSRGFVYFVDAVPASTTVPADIAPEVVIVGKRAVYQWSPDGMGKTKIKASWVKSLGPTATARNLRTVDALLAMLDA